MMKLTISINCFSFFSKAYPYTIHYSNSIRTNFPIVSYYHSIFYLNLMFFRSLYKDYFLQQNLLFYVFKLKVLSFFSGNLLSISPYKVMTSINVFLFFLLLSSYKLPSNYFLLMIFRNISFSLISSTSYLKFANIDFRVDIIWEV